MKNSDVGLRPNIQAQATFAKSYCPQKLKFAQKKPQAGPIPSNFWCAIQKKKLCAIRRVNSFNTSKPLPPSTKRRDGRLSFCDSQLTKKFNHQHG